MVAETKQELKESILHYLPHGKAKAITGALLTSHCGERDTRPVRLAIRELVAKGYLIGLSVSGKSRGYYFIQTPEEFEECLAVLRKYCVNAAIHRRDLKRNGYIGIYKRYGQLTLLAGGTRG